MELRAARDSRLAAMAKLPCWPWTGPKRKVLKTAARNAFHEAADEYASAEYRMDVASTLAKRCLESLA